MSTTFPARNPLPLSLESLLRKRWTLMHRLMERPAVLGERGDNGEEDAALKLTDTQDKTQESSKKQPHTKSSTAQDEVQLIGKTTILPAPQRRREQETSQEAGAGETKKNPDFVKQHCNEEHLQQLLEVGISPLRAEKALFKTRSGRGGGSLDAALQWLEQHDEDEDIDEPVTEEEAPATKKPLTVEEAERQAYELQKRMREGRVEREKKEAQEREKLRLTQTKAMLEQSTKLEEQQRKRQLASLQKEKEDHKKERERQRQLLRQEYRERFGCEMPEDTLTGESEEARFQKMNGKDKVAYWCNYMSRAYRKDQKDALRACLNTVRAYCENVKNHPLEGKYQKIRKRNAVFQSKVVPIDGALQLLKACGFLDSGDFLELKGPPDGFTLAQAVKFIDIVLQQIH